MLSHRALVDERPERSELVAELAETRRKKGLLKRHIVPPPLHERAINSLRFRHGVDAEVEINAAHRLGPLRRDVVPDQDCFTQRNTGVDHWICPVEVWRAAARRLALPHESKYFSAQMLLVIFERLGTVSRKIQMREEFHGDPIQADLLFDPEMSIES